MTRGFFDTPSVPALIGAIVPFVVMDLVVVVARFYTRRRQRQKLMLDDWLTIPALVGVTAMACVYFYGLGSEALGYRWLLLPPPGTDVADPNYIPETAEPSGTRITVTRKLEYTVLILHAFSIGIIKISVLCFYRRIFVIVPAWRDARNLFFITSTIFIAVWTLAYGFAYIFMCRNDVMVLFMSPELLVEKCVDTFMLAYSHSISDFITDALIILIPIPFIWSMHLPVTRKVAVSGVFLMGILASGSSLVRLAWMTYNVKVGFGGNTDEELMITTELFWLVLETSLALVAACLPTLRGLFRAGATDSTFKGARSLFTLGSGHGSGGGSGSSKTKISQDDSHEKQPGVVAKCSRGSSSVDLV